jgi:thermitase
MGRRALRVVGRLALLVIAVLTLMPLAVAPAPAQAQGRPAFVEDELLVRFKRQTPPANQAAAHGQAQAQVAREVRGLDVKVVKVPPQRLAQALQAYQRNPNVELVERNPIAYAGARPGPPAPQPAFPNDPRFPEQWGLSTIRYTAAVTAPSGTPVPTTISIVDTGVLANHEDLTGTDSRARKPVSKVKEARNWFDGGSTNDIYGHGTHVAGIAAAYTNNGKGIAGVCSDCNLISAKVCSDFGSCPHDRIANGVLWSVGCEDREPDVNGNLGACRVPVRAYVINMSISGTAGSTTLRQAMDRAAELGATMTCAAGNDNSGNPAYPASYPTCISVAATTSQDVRAPYSNYGSSVAVAAPGSDILSLLRTGRYGLMSGTSMASPHVAGLAGLLRARGIVTGPNEVAIRDAVRLRIESTADRIAGTGDFWTKGRINACRAVTPTATC